MKSRNWQNVQREKGPRGRGFKVSRAQKAAKAQWPNKANSSQGVGEQYVIVAIAANGADGRIEEKTWNVESSKIRSPHGGRLRRALLPSGKRGDWAPIAHIVCPWYAHPPFRRRRGGSLIDEGIGTLFALSSNVRHLSTDGPRSAENQEGRHAVEEGRRELVKVSRECDQSQKNRSRRPRPIEHR